jgi:hypothetical protein
MTDNIWLVLPKTDALVSPYDLYDTSQRIAAAKPFSVTLTNAVVAQDLDGIFRGRNDVLLLTKSSLGAQPEVERIHYYEEGVAAGKPLKNLLANSVFVTDDYNGKDRLWLEMNVLEIDTDTGERKAAIQAFQGLAATAGAVFPAAVPYAFGVSAAVTVVEKLVSALERDEKVVKVPLSLHADEPSPGRAPLQVGSFIAFSQPVDPEKFRLDKNGSVFQRANNKPSEVSYCVFSVRPESEVVPEYVLNQKVATLLTQIKNGNKNSAQGTIAFLQDTLAQYSNFKKLQRYRGLIAKVSPSDEEKALIDELGGLEELKPFLPKKA